jgi:hypothetical protein
VQPVQFEGPHPDLEPVRVRTLRNPRLEPVLTDIAPRAAQVRPHLDDDLRPLGLRYLLNHLPSSPHW